MSPSEGIESSIFLKTSSSILLQTTMQLFLLATILVNCYVSTEESTGFTVFVTCVQPNQMPFSIDLPSHATIGFLKDIIHQTQHLSPEQQVRLKFGGTELKEENHTPLSDFGVGAESVIEYDYHLDADKHV